MIAPEKADKIFFNGTVMTGQPMHQNLRGARLIGETKTAPHYRLYSINDEYPAMVPVADGGFCIAGELYEVPDDVWLSIEEREPPGLYRGRITLIDGQVVYGMLGEESLLTSRSQDISAFGGWRDYLTWKDMAEDRGSTQPA